MSSPRDRTYFAGLFLTLLLLLVVMMGLAGVGAYWLIREDARAFASRSAEDRVSRVFDKMHAMGPPYRSEARIFFALLDGRAAPVSDAAPAPIATASEIGAVDAERVYMFDPADGGAPEWWPYAISGDVVGVGDNLVQLHSTTTVLGVAGARRLDADYVGAERVWPGSGARLVALQRVEAIGILHQRVAGLTAAILLALIVVSGLAVMLAQRRFWRRVQRINGVCADIAADGDLGQRVPEDGGDALGLVGQNINRMLGEIEDRSRLVATQDRFLDHDYRLPIADIIASCNILLSSAPPSGPLVQGLNRILVLARQMDQASQERLELYRFDRDIQRGDTTGLERLDLREIAQEAVDGNWVEAEKRQVVAVVDGATEVFVMGSRSLILRALGNLTRNAIQHSPPGARVDVRVIAGDSPAVEIRDRGEGMSASGIAEVCGANAGVLSTTGGSGLGLALVRGVAKAHKGEFSLANASPGLVAQLKFLPSDGIGR